jgi:hypothetical protein
MVLIAATVTWKRFLEFIGLLKTSNGGNCKGTRIQTGAYRE